LIISSLVNWDKLIAQNQINDAKHIDVLYLTNLSDTALPELQSLLTNKNVNLDVQVYDYTNSNSSTPLITEREFIENQIKRFKENYPKKDWQSWNYDDLRVLGALNGEGI
jgi:Domain of unknown function (DUF4173)